MRYQKKLLDESQRVDAKLYTTDKRHSYLNSLRILRIKNVNAMVKSADVNQQSPQCILDFRLDLQR